MKIYCFQYCHHSKYIQMNQIHPDVSVCVITIRLLIMIVIMFLMLYFCAGVWAPSREESARWSGMDKGSGDCHYFEPILRIWTTFQNFSPFSEFKPNFRISTIFSLYLLTAFFLLSGAALFLDLLVEEKTKKVNKQRRSENNWGTSNLAVEIDMVKFWIWSNWIKCIDIIGANLLQTGVGDKYGDYWETPPPLPLLSRLIMMIIMMMMTIILQSGIWDCMQLAQQ